MGQACSPTEAAAVLPTHTGGGRSRGHPVKSGKPEQEVSDTKTPAEGPRTKLCLASGPRYAFDLLLELDDLGFSPLWDRCHWEIMTDVTILRPLPNTGYTISPLDLSDLLTFK